MDVQLRDRPVLIIGAGITGLVLAQALKKKKIPFLVFERDAAADSRLQGWALTIHFSLPHVLSLLPESIVEQLDSTLFDPEAPADKHDSVFINLADCTVKWRFPLGPRSRKRVCRDKFRRLLLQGLDDEIHWGKYIVSFDPLEVGARAHFRDGTSYEGLLLVGADGVNSVVRRVVYGPEASQPNLLPLRFLGTSVVATHKSIKAMLDIDPMLFQGHHSDNSAWMWFSVMERPGKQYGNALPEEEQEWKIQLCLSWPSKNEPSEMPETNEGRLLKMREIANGFDPRLRAIFEDVLQAEGTTILDISLAEWHLPTESSDHFQGQFTLAGDAAHAMAPHRGEGFNHAMLDVYDLVSAIERLYDKSVPETQSYIWKVREQAITAYEREVRKRGEKAVRMCHEACLAVHGVDALNACDASKAPLL